MRRLISILCVLIMIAMCFFLARVSEEIPGDASELVEEKYAGWSGVLRLWVYEGWESGSGSLAGWLNRCAASYEKAHPGVYVQPKYVDAQAIRQIPESGVNPPDMILFPTGLLEDWEFLAPLSEFSHLRARLGASGQGYAAPVAMGAYAWAYNRAFMDFLPADWSEISAPIGAGEDGAFTCRSGALLALCSGLYSEEGGEVERILPGLDLGLPATEATPAPTASPTPAESQPCRLPTEFSLSETAYTDFVNGKLAAIPITQRELQRLSTLSESGRGPDWAVATAGDWLFADQVLYLGVVEWERKDIGERQALCLQFLEHLLREDCQRDLAAAGAFPVTTTEGVYAQHSSYAVLEAALGQTQLIVPNAFASAWRAEAQALLEQFRLGTITAREGLTLLRAKCGAG